MAAMTYPGVRQPSDAQPVVPQLRDAYPIEREPSEAAPSSALRLQKAAAEYYEAQNRSRRALPIAIVTTLVIFGIVVYIMISVFGRAAATP